MLQQLYVFPIGVYVTMATSNSLGDSMGLRALGRTVNGASIILQEAQYTDEGTDHAALERMFVVVVG